METSIKKLRNYKTNPDFTLKIEKMLNEEVFKELSFKESGLFFDHKSNEIISAILAYLIVLSDNSEEISMNSVYNFYINCIDEKSNTKVMPLKKYNGDIFKDSHTIQLEKLFYFSSNSVDNITVEYIKNKAFSMLEMQDSSPKTYSVIQDVVLKKLYK